MAVIELKRRETSAPTTPRKKFASIFFSSKTPSSISSFSNHFPSPSRYKLSETMMEENIEIAEKMITKWDVDTPLFHGNRSEGNDYIKCVKDLRRAMHFLVTEHSNSSKLVQAQNLMQIAMQRLEKEFHQILSVNHDHLKPESVSSSSSYVSRSQSNDSEDGETETDDEIQMAGESISDMERLALLAMSDLRLIADCMISSGYSKECVKVYRILRKSIVAEALHHLGIEHHTSSQINKMCSESLDRHVKNWLNVVKTATKTLFHGERFLCDHVFSTSQQIRETCFTDIAKEEAINLFRFPELVAKSKRSSDKIFQLLDLYESIQDLFPEIESIFSYESVSVVKLQALSSLEKLGNSINFILSEFETLVQKSSSKAPIHGEIHSLTTTVINYASSLANYSETLSQILTDSPPSEKSPFPESYFDSPNSDESPTSAITIRLAWIILILLCKLDSKAGLYKDVALSYLFLVNNIQFIVEKVRTTNLKYLLGDDWIEKLDKKVKTYSGNYKALAWTKVLSCLPEDSLEEISPEVVKVHFKKFNSTFEEVYKKQISWVVPDSKLRDEIKLSIARKLVPAYQEFYDTHLATLSGETNLEDLVRFSPDNLGNYLSDLFHGTTTADLGSSSSSRSRAPRQFP